MKGYELLATALHDHGVTTMFGVMGDGNMFFVDNFVRDHGGRYVAAANEAGTVLMAAGFASGRGSVGVASVTHGPGLANALGSLVTATRDHAQVVLIVGETSNTRPGVAQRIDQPFLVAPTGAGYERAASAATIPFAVARAFRRAVVERRPIVLGVSVDFTFVDVDAMTATPSLLGPPQALHPDPSAMDVAVGLIASAHRPIVLAGRGACSPDAGASLRALAHRLGAAVATTLPAKGLFAGEKTDLGVFGTFSTPAASDAIMASDCVVAVGAGLNKFTGGGDTWPFFAGKRVIHCDVDQTAIGLHLHADAAVVADARVFADTVVDWLDQVDHVPSGFGESVVGADHLADEPVTHGTASNGCVDLGHAMDALNRALPVERSIAIDAGRFVSEAVRRLDVPRERSWACSFGFGAIGNGLSTAIGLGSARDDAPVVAVVGDGGFMLGGIAEFNTAVRHGIDLIVIVCNDGSYGAEYRKLAAHGFETEASLFAWPDFAPVASALGGHGVTVRDAEDLDRLGDVIAHRDRPLLIDVKLDPAVVAHDH